MIIIQIILKYTIADLGREQKLFLKGKNFAKPSMQRDYITIFRHVAMDTVFN